MSGPTYPRVRSVLARDRSWRPWEACKSPGVGGHAAFPHSSIDPVLTLAKVICELQSIVSREVDPLESAVVSVTTLEGGTAFNVIPDTVTARGTIRALTT